MKQLERRKVVQLAMAFAVAPSFVSAPLRAASPSANPDPVAITPPDHSMIYKRRIQRQLADGAFLSVERSFAVRFIAEGTGFRLTGEQTDVNVEAPQELGGLIALEEGRVETGIFPIMLTEHGSIQSGSNIHESHQIETALKQVSAEILRSNRSLEEQRELQNFIAALHQVGSNIISSLPHDLFAPTQDKRSISREVTMADGIIGEVTSTFAAFRDPRTNLMRKAKREIVTRMDDDARHTVEHWSLMPN